VLEAGRALVLLLKTRLAEVTAERDRLAMVVNALRACAVVTGLNAYQED